MLTVPVAVEHGRQLAHHRARRQDVHVDEIGRLAAAEVWVGHVAATTYRERVVGDEQLVVHAAVDARELVHREHHARHDTAAAHRQRVEHAHFNVGVAGQRGEQVVLPDREQVVEQDAHAHATRGGVAQLAQELQARRVVRDQVVLRVERLLCEARQRDARVERLVTGGQQAKTRQLALVFGRVGGGDLRQDGGGDVGDRLRNGALHAARQARAAEHRHHEHDECHAERHRGKSQ